VTLNTCNSGSGAWTLTVNDASTEAARMQMPMESIRYNNTAGAPDDKFACSLLRACGSSLSLLTGDIGIGAVSVADRSPATPPGMRVRTGRFEKLRS
jgi:hypothetical protein